MVNTCKPLINVVTSNKPKRMIGLKQKGKRPGIGALSSSIADAAPPAKRRDLTLPFGNHVERGKPVSLPLGKQIARRADRDAGMGCQKKRMPSCSGLDKSYLQPERVLTSDGSKIRRSSAPRR